MNMLSDLSCPPEGAQAASPGQQFKWLREAAGLSLQQVANSTRIPRARLEALERDDYARAGSGPAYVLGYVRAYSKLLGCSGQDWLVAFETRLKAACAPQEAALPVAEPVLLDTHHRLHILPWVAVFLAVLLVWLLGAEFRGGQKALSPTVTSPELSQLNALAATDRLAKDIVTPSSAPNETAPSPPAAQPVAAALPVEPVRANSATSSVTAAAAQAWVVGNDGQVDLLQVAAKGDCWIRIVDANGKAVFTRLMRSGDNLRVQGAAPFTIKLGDATQVSLWLNARSLPLTLNGSSKTLNLVATP